MEAEDSPLADGNAVRSMLMGIAQNHTSYAMALMASSQIRELVGNVDLMPKDCTGKDAAQLTDLITAKSATEATRVANTLDRKNVERIVNEHYARLQTSFSNKTDDWKRDIPREVVLNVFAAKAKIPVARLKTLYLRHAATMPHNPFAEVIALFEEFSKCQSTGD